MEGEICQECGEPYLTTWWAPSGLWRAITGAKDGEGTWCVPCFDKEARQHGIALYWTCAADRYPGEPDELALSYKAKEMAVKQLAGMTERQQVAFLCYSVGFNQEETAEIMGVRQLGVAT